MRPQACYLMYLSTYPTGPFIHPPLRYDPEGETQETRQADGHIEM